MYTILADIVDKGDDEPLSQSDNLSDPLEVAEKSMTNVDDENASEEELYEKRDEVEYEYQKNADNELDDTSTIKKDDEHASFEKTIDTGLKMNEDIVEADVKEDNPPENKETFQDFPVRLRECHYCINLIRNLIRNRFSTKLLKYLRNI